MFSIYKSYAVILYLNLAANSMLQLALLQLWNLFILSSDLYFITLGMSKPKSLSKAFSKIGQQCSTKLKIINNYKQSSISNPMSLVSYFANQPSLEAAIIHLQKQPFHFNFSHNKQRQFVIVEQTLNKLKAINRTAAVVINSNVQIVAIIKFDIEGFQRKKCYRFQGTKAILLKQIQRGQVKVFIQVKKTNPYANVKIYIDTMQTEFQPKTKLNVSKIKKQDIQQFIKLNRGRSVQILKNRAQRIRQTHSSQRLRSANSFKLADQNLYRPLSTTGSKRQIKQIRQFQKQKSRYINHMQKMSPEKGVLLQQTYQLYLSKKQQEVRDLVRLIKVSNFAYLCRVKTLKYYMKKIKQIKIQMLCQDFCQIMKSKLRYKITQRARYRMTVKQSLAFSSQIFYNVFRPKAETKIYNALMQIQNFKTLLKLTNESTDYLQKTIKIQRYIKRKRYLKIIAISQIIKKKLEKAKNILNPQKYKKIEQNLASISEQYLKKCYQKMKSADLICSLHKNSQNLFQEIVLANI